MVLSPLCAHQYFNMHSLCLVYKVNDLTLYQSVVVWSYIRGKYLQTFFCSFRVLWSGRVSASSATWNSQHIGISDVPPGATLSSDCHDLWLSTYFLYCLCHLCFNKTILNHMGFPTVHLPSSPNASPHDPPNSTSSTVSFSNCAFTSRHLDFNCRPLHGNSSSFYGLTERSGK